MVYWCHIKSFLDWSIRSQGQVVGTVPDQQHEAEDPHSIDGPFYQTVVFQISKGLLVYPVVEVHHCCGIHVVDGLELRPEDTHSVQEADRVGKPRNVVVEEDRRKDEQTCHVMDVEWLEADRVPSIEHVLRRHIVDVVEAGENQEESGEMVGPEMSLEARVEIPVDTSDDEWQDKDTVAIDPDVIGHVVVILPVNALDPLLHWFFSRVKYFYYEYWYHLANSKKTCRFFYFLNFWLTFYFHWSLLWWLWLEGICI